jgi:hypothetical protein
MLIVVGTSSTGSSRTSTRNGSVAAITAPGRCDEDAVDDAGDAPLDVHVVLGIGRI